MASLLTKPSHILHLTKFCCSRQLHFGKRLVGYAKLGRWFAIPSRIFSVLAGSGLLAGVVVSHVFSDDGPTELDGAVPGEKKTKWTATPRGLPEPPSTETKTFRQAVTESRDLLQRVKDETGSPGLVIGVSVDGRVVWTEGLGYSDVENRVAMSADSVLRIASISKSITMAIVAKLWEAGKLDLDAPVQKYVPDFPEKVVDGEKVTITTRQLVSHLSGIRHYEKQPKKKGTKDKENNKSSKEEKNKAAKEEDNKDIVKERAEGDSKFKEFYLKRKFSSVSESLKLFKDDPLIHKPGSEFLYTTHGWTLVSAAVEGASGETFPKLLAGLFLDLGLNNTFMDQNDPLIYHRGRNYVKNPKGRLVNAPYVDNSYKWAGGGLLSTVGDLLKFGNAMLYSYQHCGENTNIHGECQNAEESSKKSKPSLEVENKKSYSIESSSRAPEKPSKKINGLPGYLKAETVKEMWTLVKNTECSWDKSWGYGMGWYVVPEKQEHGCCAHRKYYVSHTGGAMGASSVLLIYPRMLERLDQGQISEGHSKVQGQGHSSEHRNFEKRIENTVSLGDRSLMKDLARGQGQVFRSKSLPQGISVAIIANTSSVGLNKTALKVAQIFEQTNL